MGYMANVKPLGKAGYKRKGGARVVRVGIGLRLADYAKLRRLARKRKHKATAVARDLVLQGLEAQTG